MSYKKYLHLPFSCLILLMTLLTGCINEYLDECPPEFALRLKALNADNQDITESGEVTQSTLFIFDENKQLLEARSLDQHFITSRQEIVLTNYAPNTWLHLVAWGNLGAENQQLGTINTLTDLQVALNHVNGLASEPDSLFYGNLTVLTGTTGILRQDQEIVIVPKTATLKIETRGLPHGLAWNGLKSDTYNPDRFDYYMNHTLHAFDSEGNQTGDSIRYSPDGIIDNYEYVTEHDYNVCPGTNLSVALHFDNKVLAAITEAENIDQGETGPIHTYAGKRTYVIIYFGQDGSISAKMKITPWGVVDENIEF